MQTTLSFSRGEILERTGKGYLSARNNSVSFLFLMKSYVGKSCVHWNFLEALNAIRIYVLDPTLRFLAFSKRNS